MASAPVLVIAFLGCTRNALIQTTRGEREGRIVAATREGVDIEGEEGERTRIPRADIRDIAHPGRAVLGWSLLPTALGVLGTVAVCPTLGPEPLAAKSQVGGGGGIPLDAATCGAGVTAIGIGLAMAIWGGVTWSGSRSLAAQTGPPRVPWMTDPLWPPAGAASPPPAAAPPAPPVSSAPEDEKETPPTRRGDP